jgi:hypothetical protein
MTAAATRPAPLARRTAGPPGLEKEAVTVVARLRMLNGIRLRPFLLLLVGGEGLGPQGSRN